MEYFNQHSHGRIHFSLLIIGKAPRDRVSVWEWYMTATELCITVTKMNVFLIFLLLKPQI